MSIDEKVLNLLTRDIVEIKIPRYVCSTAAVGYDHYNKKQFTTVAPISRNFFFRQIHTELTFVRGKTCVAALKMMKVALI